MRKLLCLALLFFTLPSSSASADLVGLFEFQNAANVGEATIGNDLTLNNTNGTITSVAGIGSIAGDFAISVGIGDYLSLTHDMDANGGSSVYVNEYSLVFDVFLPLSSDGTWRTLYQTNSGNTNDGDYWLRASDNAAGVSAIGYVDAGMTSGNWYRIVLSADIGDTIAGGTGSFLTTVIDEAGNRATYNHASQSLDGRHSLYSTANDNIIHFFADENGEDNELQITQLGVYNSALTGGDLDALGTPGTSLLAIPEPTGIFGLVLTLGLLAPHRRR